MEVLRLNSWRQELLEKIMQSNNISNMKKYIFSKFLM